MCISKPYHAKNLIAAQCLFFFGRHATFLSKVNSGYLRGAKLKKIVTFYLWWDVVKYSD